MNGPLAQIDFAVLSIFALGTLVAVCAVTVISSFLPTDSNPVVSASKLAAAGLYASIGLSAVLVAILLLTCVQLPLAVTIIVIGLAILGGPLLVDVIPRPLRESGLAIGFTLLLTIASLFALLWSL